MDLIIAPLISEIVHNGVLKSSQLRRNDVLVTMAGYGIGRCAASYFYSPSSKGQHELTVTVTDATGHSVTSQPIVESYGYNYKTIFLTLLTILAIAVGVYLAIIAFLSRRRNARADYRSLIEVTCVKIRLWKLASEVLWTLYQSMF